LRIDRVHAKRLVFWATARAYDPAVALTQAPWCRSAATDFMTERIQILDFG
jgi:hypothetical protein